jgi:hypothetical protein
MERFKRTISEIGGASAAAAVCRNIDSSLFLLPATSRWRRSQEPLDHRLHGVVEQHAHGSGKAAAEGLLHRPEKRKDFFIRETEFPALKDCLVQSAKTGGA